MNAGIPSSSALPARGQTVPLAVRELAAALEAGSGHPIAGALAAAAPASAKYRCSGINHVVGSGIEAVVGAVRVRLGAPHSDR